MNKNDLYNALSGINKDFIAESENFNAIAADFRKDRIRKISIAASTLCLAVLCVGTIGIFGNGTPKRNNHPTEENNIIISTDVSQAENSVQTTINVSEQTSTSQEAAVVTSETMNSDITSTKESIQINQTESIKVTSEPATDAAQSAAKQSSAKTTKTNAITQTLSKQSSAQTNATIQTVTEQTTSPNNENGNKLYYSQLVRNTEAPVLDGYDGSSASLSIQSFDIEAFSDSVLNESLAVVEGEILDMWVNHYDYATASDKFEPNGRLYHKPSTVAYKIRVDKVYSGDFSVGDVVTIEDYIFMLDSVISVKTGGTYVIPIAEGDGILWEYDEVVSGNNIMESKYYTYYQFHPQIEKVSGGYVVPGDWKTLITDECTEIIMDTDNSFYAGMYYVPDGVFNDRISLIL